MGAVAVSMGIKMGSGQLERRHWPTVKGHILERGVKRDDRSFTQNSTYAPAVKYRYVVNGREYLGDQTYPPPGYTEGPGPDRMQRVVDGLPAEIPVHYNPQNPTEAFLIPYPMFIPMASLLLGSLALLAGALLLLAKVRKG